MSIILGIETSCDETAASIVEDGKNILSNIVSSQIAQHSPYGGVVPELAAREHLKAIEYITREALRKAEVSIYELNAVAVTYSPGLIPALLVGTNFAKGLALSQRIPLIPVNHFTAHIYAAFLEDSNPLLYDDNLFPLLALVVSGGHTALILVEKNRHLTLVGTTLDDAAGEAFDKGAKILNIGYPGGPVIEKFANNGNPEKFSFPRALTGSTGKPVTLKNRFNFSFSGLKTSLLYHCKKYKDTESFTENFLFDTAASYQKAIVEALTEKTLDAVKYFKASALIVCGGVACNKSLREFFRNNVPDNVRLIITEKKYCTDNAAMVAGLAYQKLKKQDVADINLDPIPRLTNIEKEYISSVY